MGFNSLGIFAADTHAAVAHLHQHRTSMLNHADSRARNKAEIVKPMHMARIAMNISHDTFFTGLPTTQAACTHGEFLVTT